MLRGRVPILKVGVQGSRRGWNSLCLCSRVVRQRLGSVCEASGSRPSLDSSNGAILVSVVTFGPTRVEREERVEGRGEMRERREGERKQREESPLLVGGAEY